MTSTWTRCPSAGAHAGRNSGIDVAPSWKALPRRWSTGEPTYARDGDVEVGFVSQKRYISLYILRTDVLDSHRRQLSHLNVGKGCIRYTKPEQIDFDLVDSMLKATAATPRTDLLRQAAQRSACATRGTPGILAAAGPDLAGLRPPKVRRMNEAHQRCGSDEWRAIIRESILPWAMGTVDLGDDVLEVGPGYGATTDVLCKSVPRLTAVEIDAELAAMLTERYAGRPNVDVLQGDATALDQPDGRFSGAACFTMLHHVPTVELQDRLFAEVARVLRPGAALVASDSLASEERRRPSRRRHVQPGRSRIAAAAPGGGRFRRGRCPHDPFGWAVIART